MTFPFVPGYPQDNSTLGQSKTTIRNNINGTFSTLGIDHINNNGAPGAQPAGYHNVTHWVPKAADPGREANYGQLYSKTVSGDQQLFWRSGANPGFIQQITSSRVPLSALSGYTPLAGGILLQWGMVNTALPATGSVSFMTSTGLNFTTFCFNVQITPFYGVTVPGQVISIALEGLSNTGFNWKAISLSNNYTGFFWTAIGN